MELFDLFAVVIAFAAFFSYVNARTLRLPQTVGLLLSSLAVSAGILLLDSLVPHLSLRASVGALVEQAQFAKLFLQGALAFLLFAGALHVDSEALLNRKWSVLTLATLGVILSTGLFACAMYGVFAFAGMPVPFSWCLVLGAIVAPTDPVAVLDMLKRVGFDKETQAVIAGESLFNDGVGVVVFTLLLALATHPNAEIPPREVAEMFLLEAVGGGLLGLACGYVAYRAIRSIREHDVELLITVALVMVTYSLADRIGVSGPIGEVVAGLFMGAQRVRSAFSALAREKVKAFWALVEEVLNALLFLFIGFELLTIEVTRPALLAAAGAVIVSLPVRAVSVAVPTLLIDFRMQAKAAYISLLTWAGLRAGVAMALALSVPHGPYRTPLLVSCYAIMIFTVIVQGLTLERVLRFFRRGSS